MAHQIAFLLDLEGPWSKLSRSGSKYIEMYLNTSQLLSLINDYDYIINTGPVEM